MSLSQHSFIVKASSSSPQDLGNESKSNSQVTLDISSRRGTDGILRLSDPNEVCMKAIFNSFSIDEMSSDYASHYPGRRAVLFLNDLTKFNITLNSNSDLPNNIKKSPELWLTSLAMDSILKRLRKHDVIKCDALYYQARLESCEAGVSDFQLIHINEQAPVSEDLPYLNKNETISHTYGYIAEGIVCLFLTNKMTPELETKLKEALNEFLPEKSLKPAEGIRPKV